MDAASLMSSAAEFALGQLEQRGVLIPFCHAVTADGSSVIYSPETNDPEDTAFRKAEAHQRDVVLREVSQRQIVGLAFCKEITLTMSEPDEVLSAVRIELHQIDTKSLIYFFPYRMNEGKATLLPYYTRDIEAVVLWTPTTM